MSDNQYSKATMIDPPQITKQPSGSALSGILMGLILVVCLLHCLTYISTNLTLLWQGFVEGRWYIDALDFKFTIILQWALGLIAIWFGSTWFRYALFSFQDLTSKASSRPRSFRLTVITWFLMVLVHRWFEIIICTRGILPSECGL